MVKEKKSIIWGIIIVIVGILFLGNNLDIWGFNLFFDGWWTLFIIVPSVIGLFYKENAMSGVLGIIIGVLLLMAAQDLIAWNMVGKIFIPFVIICVGISLLIKPSFKNVFKKRGNGSEYLGIFGGVDEVVDKKFNNATCIAVFGGVELDLTNAIIEEDIVIDCVAVFGGVDLILPKNVSVKTSGVSIFGGASNEHKDDKKNKGPVVHVNHVSIFGGTDLK